MEIMRKATLSDKKQVHKLLIQLEETDIDYKCFTKIFHKNLDHPQVFYFVYEKENLVLGFISIHVQKLLHHTSNIAEIQELIVDETIRNQGIGKLLFQKAKEVAINTECKQLEVCCNQRRLDSHKFYQSQGMTNTHYKFCLPFDHLLT